MARATHIYLIYKKGLVYPLAVFTVKHESQTWAEESNYKLRELQRFRMRDNPLGEVVLDDIDDCPFDTNTTGEHDD